MTASMQRFKVHDLPGMYRVCADVDARGTVARQWLHSPELAGHVFVGPYVTADPALSWVIADELGVAGYILGTADTVDFDTWRETSWYPPLRTRHPQREARADGSADDRYLRFMHSPPRAAGAVPAGYPAELHIKLDPRVAGAGWGRQLVEALLGELRRRGVPGIHLGVAAENANAIAFYAHLGFRTVTQGPGSFSMVKDIA